MSRLGNAGGHAAAGYAGTGGVSHSPDHPPIQTLMTVSLGVSKERVQDREAGQRGKEVIALWKLLWKLGDVGSFCSSSAPLAGLVHSPPHLTRCP